MTNPTPLSPAAQAVLQAFDYERDGEYIDGEWVVNERAMLAAALRAAAKHTKAHVRDSAPPTDWGQGWVEGVKNAACGLGAIADELEGWANSPKKKN